MINESYVNIRIIRGSDSPVFLRAKKGENLYAVLRGGGIAVNSPCGGNKKCGKCRVEISAEGALPERSAFVKSKCRGGNEYLCCDTVVTGDMTVKILSGSGAEGEDGAVIQIAWSGAEIVAHDGEHGAGVAADIGTTTVVLYAYDLATGKQIGSKSALNPQRKYGLDVMSRIGFALSGGASKLTEDIRTLINTMCAELLADTDYGAFEKMVVTGNTAMLYLFNGIKVDCLAVFPFKAMDTAAKTLKGAEVGQTFVKTVLTAPCMASFVGGDTVCALLAAGLKENQMLLDLGTNGEIVLRSGGKYYCCSAAAGPAFEGAEMDCGTGCIGGAVYDFKLNGNTKIIKTVGGGAARGICGSGYIRIISALIKAGKIDETGYTEEEKYFLTDSVYLSAKDIRKFQLAKGAIFAAAEILLQAAGIAAGDVSAVILAGGFGSVLNPDDMESAGILSPKLAAASEGRGNLAVLGAINMLLSRAATERAAAVAGGCVHIELNRHPDFQTLFSEGMMF